MKPWIIASLLLLIGTGSAKSDAIQTKQNQAGGRETELAAGPRVRECFDPGWSFFRGDPEGANGRSFDHSGWRRLDLPHDWSIEGPYDKEAPSGASGGYLPCGIGWYRKSFRLPAEVQGRMVFIEFDGVHMNGEVWINGHRLGKRPYGYVGFQYNLTPPPEP